MPAAEPGSRRRRVRPPRTDAAPGLALRPFAACVVLALALVAPARSSATSAASASASSLAHDFSELNGWENIVDEVQVVAVKGQSLWLPCDVPDLRAAAQIHREVLNELLKYKNNAKSSSDNHPHDNPNQKLGKTDDSSENIEVPESDKDHFDSINDDFYSDDDSIDTTDNIKKKSEMNKRKLNKKLEKKQLDNTPKKPNKVLLQTSIEAEPDVPITYQWFLNDKKINLDDSKHVVMENGTLLIKRFGGKRGSVQDTGKYHCSTTNSHGTVISTSMTVNLASIDRNFTVYPTDTDVNEGDAMRLMCSIKSSPNAQISWQKNGLTLPNDRRYYAFPSSSLLIINSQISDSGEYRCIAVNNMLNKTKYSPSAKVSVSKSNLKTYNLEFVNVKDFKELQSNSSSKIIPVVGIYGKDISLGCAIKGRPKAKVVWNFKSDRDDIENKEIISMEILKIDRLTEDKNGIYTCIANNGNQIIKQMYNLTVFQPPYLKQSPSPFNTPAARTVRFNCTGGGNPQPKITWYKDGKPLPITGRVKFKSSEKRLPELIISDTITSDKGFYQCIASNPLGEVTGSASLSFWPTQSFINPPFVMRCIPLSKSTIYLTWKTPEDIAVVAHTIHYLSGNAENSILHDNTEYTFTLKNPYEEYEFYTKIYTSAGASDQSVHVTCQGQGVPFKITPMNNDSVLIKWEFLDTVKQWRVQWRLQSDPSNIVNVTLPDNTKEYSINNISPVDNYEFRILASLTDKWLDQDLSEIPWISTNTSSFYNINFEEVKENTSALFPIIDNSQNSGDMDDAYISLKPVEVSAISTTSRSINITWKCDLGDKDVNLYLYVICFSKYDESAVSSNTKLEEMCKQSHNNWIEISELEPDTLYAFKVQAVKRNLKQVGSFSEVVFCRTRHEGDFHISATNSVTNIRWSFLDNGIKISWSPNIHFKTIKNEDDIFRDKDNDDYMKTLNNTHSFYTIYYSHSLSTPFHEWKTKNVTNSTEIEIKNLDIHSVFYVRISAEGEETGTVITILPKNKINNPLHNLILETSSDSNNLNLTNIIIIIIIVGVMSSCLSIPLFIAFLRSKKQTKNSQNAQKNQSKTNRFSGSIFECQELVSPSTHIDTKGGVHYMNGLTNEIKENNVGEPLLNGHVHITENPRFSKKKHLPNGNCGQSSKKKKYGPLYGGILDVSRCDDSPNITMESTLGIDSSLTIDVDCSHIDMDSNQMNPEMITTSPQVHPYNDIFFANSNDCKILTTNGVELVAKQVDRNSNSQVSIINKIKESLNNDNVENCEVSVVNPVKAKVSKEIQEKKTEEGNFNSVGVKFSKLDNIKYNNQSLEEMTGFDYRENGNSRRITPALGPNG